MFCKSVSLLSSGDDCFNPALKNASFEENAVSAFEALHPNVGAESDHLPLVAAAGVFLLEADHVTQLYLHNHSFPLKVSI